MARLGLALVSAPVVLASAFFQPLPPPARQPGASRLPGGEGPLAWRAAAPAALPLADPSSSRARARRAEDGSPVVAWAAAGAALGAAMAAVAALRPARPVAQLGFFDGLAKAFENDDTLGEAGPAGLAQKAKVVQITWAGPKPEGAAALFGAKQPLAYSEAIPGQKLKDLGLAAKIPIEYSCNKGTCHICDVTIDGVSVPACTGVCPDKDITIEYRDRALAEAYAKDTLAAEREARRAAKKGKVVPTGGPEERPRPDLSQGALAARLMAEAEEAQATKKKGGWPFG